MDFGTFYVIEFDDGTAEGQILHRGDRESCERVADSFPAVAYSGPKRARGAFTRVASWDDVAEAFGLEGAVTLESGGA